jgi:hypothetical protein
VGWFWCRVGVNRGPNYGVAGITPRPIDQHRTHRAVLESVLNCQTYWFFPDATKSRLV